jgi:trigger factor
MSATVERLGTSEVKIRVEIPWSELEASYKESLSKVRTSIQVRGFRPGKAPRSMIEKMVGERLAREVAVDEVGQRIQELIRKEKIMPLRLPIGVEQDLELGSDREARFEATVEVLPMVGRIGFEGLELDPRKEVTDEAVRQRVTLIAARKAPLETAPEDHPVGEYDQVVLEGKAKFEGEESGPEEVKDFRVDLAPWSEPPPALVKKLEGKKAGESGEVDIVLPDPKGEKGSRYAHLSYTISEVITRRVPAIDEDLAKDFDFESLSELEGMVRETLEKEALDDYIARNGDAILEQMIDRVEFDLPPSYRGGGIMGPAEPPEGEEEDEEARKAREQQEKIAQMYERFSRRNLLGMLIAFQNNLTLPEEAMKQASEKMRQYIDDQEGSRQEKEQAYEQWRREFEQSMFNKVLSSFLVQEAEKHQEKAGEGEPDEGEPGPDAEET